jgi:membrane protease YdiL (CAAX protease family)
MLFAIVLPLTFLVGELAQLAGWLGGEGVSLADLEVLAAREPVVLGALWVVRPVGVLVSLWLAVRFLDKRSFSDLGLRLGKRWWLDFVFGLGLGGLLMAAIFCIEWAAGWVSITGTCVNGPGDLPFGASALLALAIFVCVGFYEEMLSRGYQLRNCAEGLCFPGLGSRGALFVAWVATSLVFGLGHGLNPHASVASCLGVAAAGLLLGLGYILTGELAISIGLHISWNFFQGTVFGFPVSGRYFGGSFVSIEQSGPPVWTGGAFGPEAGLLGLAACLAGGLLVLLWVRIAHGRLSLHADELARYRIQPIVIKKESNNTPSG